MSSNNTDLFASILVAACLLLLLCWLNKNKDGMKPHKFVPGLKFKKEGYTGYRLSGSDFKNPNNSYTMRPRVEGFDGEPVRTMNELNTTMTPTYVKPELTANNTVALRRPDSSIQIDYLNATYDDLLSGNTVYGLDMVDPSLARERVETKSRGSLSVDILEMTDIGDRDNLYGATVEDDCN